MFLYEFLVNLNRKLLFLKNSTVERRIRFEMSQNTKFFTREYAQC